MSEKATVLYTVAKMLLAKDTSMAKKFIVREYPFISHKTLQRKNSDKQKLQIFLRDGFIDRYTGKRLINPGFLKLLSFYFPLEFPFHSHWKMTKCHKAYWELSPTIDHIKPIALGGEDNFTNLVSTSMLTNSIKSNWTLADLQWKLYAPGNLATWNGLTNSFIKLVEADNCLMEDKYINHWYSISKSEYEIFLQK